MMQDRAFIIIGKADIAQLYVHSVMLPLFLINTFYRLIQYSENLIAGRNTIHRYMKEGAKQAQWYKKFRG